MSAQTTKIPAPDQAPLTKSQAARLSGLTGIDAGQLTGLSVAEISSKFRWRIDPDLLFFRRICAKVVKRQPGQSVDARDAEALLPTGLFQPKR